MNLLIVCAIEEPYVQRKALHQLCEVVNKRGHANAVIFYSHQGKWVVKENQYPHMTCVKIATIPFPCANALQSTDVVVYQQKYFDNPQDVRIAFGPLCWLVNWIFSLNEQSLMLSDKQVLAFHSNEVKQSFQRLFEASDSNVFSLSDFVDRKLTIEPILKNTTKVAYRCDKNEDTLLKIFNKHKLHGVRICEQSELELTRDCIAFVDVLTHDIKDAFAREAALMNCIPILGPQFIASGDLFGVPKENVIVDLEAQAEQLVRIVAQKDWVQVGNFQRGIIREQTIFECEVRVLMNFLKRTLGI